jgi:hypothetical protein
MKLRQLFEAEKKVAVAAFGRLNPPTTGHKAMVDEIKKVPGDHFLFLSHSQGAKKPDAKPGTKTGENKDPLSFEEKLPLVKQAFPDVNVGSADVTTPLHMAAKLYKMGYTDLIIVAGSDRMSGYKALFPKYNGESGPHGEYKFDSIEYVELTRDEEAEDVSGMSASKLRKAVRDDDFNSFKAGLLAGNAEELFKVFRERLAKDSIGLTKQEEPEMTESDVVLDRTHLRTYIKDMIIDYLDREDDIDKLSKILKMIVGKTITTRGTRYQVSDEDISEACKYGMYYCSTEKKKKCRKGPKQSRSS